MTTHDDEFDRDSSGRSDGSNARPGSEREDRGHRSRHRRRRHQHGGRKERVLHTRISEQLSDDIRRLADDLRVPASNLVRNVLEEVFTMVESVSEDVGELFEDVLDEATEARERVRRRAARRRGGAKRRPGTGSDGRFDEDIERELRHDESAEGPETGAPRESRAEAAPSPEAGEDRPPRPVFPHVIGWQSLVLNHDRVCASCGVALPRGSRACIGLGSQGLTETTLCRPCTGMRD